MYEDQYQRQMIATARETNDLLRALIEVIAAANYTPKFVMGPAVGAEGLDFQWTEQSEEARQEALAAIEKIEKVTMPGGRRDPATETEEDRDARWAARREQVKAKPGPFTDLPES